VFEPLKNILIEKKFWRYTTQKTSENRITIERLRTGEKIECSRCHKGILVTKEGMTQVANCFWCDNCGLSHESVPLVEVN